MRLAGPALRQGRAGELPQAGTARRDGGDNGSCAIGRVIIDHEELDAIGRVGLPAQAGEAGRDRLPLVAGWHDHRDLRRHERFGIHGKAPEEQTL